MSRARGANGPGVVHRAMVNERYEVETEYRWECTCRRDGRWSTDAGSARRGAEAHERRFAPKPSGPAGLRALLKLG